MSDIWKGVLQAATSNMTFAELRALMMGNKVKSLLGYMADHLVDDAASMIKISVICKELRLILAEIIRDVATNPDFEKNIRLAIESIESLKRKDGEDGRER